MTMEYVEHEFSPDSILDSFKVELINKSNLEKFIILKINSPKNQKILKGWIDHFRGIFNGKTLKYQTPYIITTSKCGKFVTLWIEMKSY